MRKILLLERHQSKFYHLVCSKYFMRNLFSVFSERITDEYDVNLNLLNIYVF